MKDLPTHDEIKLPTFADDMNKAGISGDYLIGKLRAELEAQETKFFQKDGYVIEQKDVIAWGIRQNARQDAHKLRGDYPAEKVEHGGGIIVNIDVEAITKKEKEA